MIEMRNLSFAYGEHFQIRNLSLDIAPGEVTGLIGPNGSGKSTVLRLAAGILRAKEGCVLLDGRDIAAIPPRDRAKQVALLHQGGRVPPLQAEDVVLSARYPHSGLGYRYTAADREAVRLAMERTGCTGLADKRMDRLSGGERQKVFMAAAVAQYTDLLLLDEPTVYLDAGSAIAWMRFVREMNRECGKTVAVILHDLNLALQFCDTIILLRQGAAVWKGTPEELVESGMLSAVFHVTVQVFEREGKRYYCFG